MLNRTSEYRYQQISNPGKKTYSILQETYTPRIEKNYTYSLKTSQTTTRKGRDFSFSGNDHTFDTNSYLNDYGTLNGNEDECTCGELVCTCGKAHNHSTSIHTTKYSKYSSSSNKNRLGGSRLTTYGSRDNSRSNRSVVTSVVSRKLNRSLNSKSKSLFNNRINTLSKIFLRILGIIFFEIGCL